MEESDSGCVRGPRCGCFSQTKCEACEHCVDHHHKNCDENFQAEFLRIWAENLLRITDLRKKYRVDIFEVGENKELAKLNTFRHPPGRSKSV